MLAVDDPIESVTSPTGDYDPVAARSELLCERGPIPDPPPVTRIVFPVSFIVCLRENRG